MLSHKSLNLLLAMYFNGTVHTSNLLLDLCPRMLLEPFTLATCRHTCRRCTSLPFARGRRCTQTCRRVLSHWRHVRGRHVRAHVASVKGLGNKLSDLLPSAFTLATCAATCVATCLATCRQCESTISKWYFALSNGCRYRKKFLWLQLI